MMSWEMTNAAKDAAYALNKLAFHVGELAKAASKRDIRPVIIMVPQNIDPENAKKIAEIFHDALAE